MIKPRSFEIRITNQATKDIAKLTPKLKSRLKDILNNIIAINPYEGKKLLGDLLGSYSYRLNIKDRIVYTIDQEQGIVYLQRARTHYGQ